MKLVLGQASSAIKKKELGVWKWCVVTYQIYETKNLCNLGLASFRKWTHGNKRVGNIIFWGSGVEFSDFGNFLHLWSGRKLPPSHISSKNWNWSSAIIIQKQCETNSRNLVLHSSKYLTRVWLSLDFHLTPKNCDTVCVLKFTSLADFLNFNIQHTWLASLAKNLMVSQLFGPIVEISSLVCSRLVVKERTSWFFGFMVMSSPWWLVPARRHRRSSEDVFWNWHKQIAQLDH